MNIKTSQKKKREQLMADPLFHRMLWSPFLRSSASLPMDWLETPTSHVFKVDVPGYKRDNIKVQVEDNVLTIKGDAKREEEGEEGQQKHRRRGPPRQPEETVWHLIEREHRGEFARQIVLPDNARTDHIKAHVDDGVLTVVVPKEAAPVKPKPRIIPVSSKL